MDEYYKDLRNQKIRLPKDITDGYFGNYKYQRDAILRGIEILNQHNGVLISDVVRKIILLHPKMCRFGLKHRARERPGEPKSSSGGQFRAATRERMREAQRFFFEWV